MVSSTVCDKQTKEYKWHGFEKQVICTLVDNIEFNLDNGQYVRGCTEDYIREKRPDAAITEWNMKGRQAVRVKST